MIKHFIKRALAYWIDCAICYALVMLIIQWVILSPVRENFGITDEWFQISLNLELYVLISISLPVWAYFTYFDSSKAKGTFGKRIFKLSVSDMADNKIGLGKSFVRTFLKLLPWEIAHLGVIFPTPMYFDTDPSIRMLTIVGISLFLIYSISILIHSDGRAIYDRLIGTKVSRNEGIKFAFTDARLE